jgi:hypothetical protein
VTAQAAAETEKTFSIGTTTPQAAKARVREKTSDQVLTGSTPLLSARVIEYVSGSLFQFHAQMYRAKVID